MREFTIGASGKDERTGICCPIFRKSFTHDRASLNSRMGAILGTSGHVVGMKTFGASAPLKELQKKFGFEPEQVIAAAKAQLGRK